MISDLINFFIKNANSKVLISLASITKEGIFSSIKDSIIEKANNFGMKYFLKENNLTKKDLKRYCSDITYEHFAERGMHNLKDVLLKINPDDTKDSKEFIKNDYNEAKKVFEQFSKKVANLEDDQHTPGWSSIVTQREGIKANRMHKLYYTYNKDRGEILSGVEAFKKTFIEVSKELSKAFNNNDISFLSIKFPHKFYDYLYHSDSIVIHFINELEFNKMKPVIDSIIYSNKNFLDKETRIRKLHRSNIGHDIKKSDTSDFSDFVADKLIFKSSKYSSGIDKILNRDMSSDDVLDKSINDIGTLLAFCISESILTWHNLSYKEKEDLLM